ncbi:DNA mismatch endonuclease Vsr [Mesorhizobium sp. WSM4307]|nr:DNA mismatch endonuclease Vsr [Mesorhizobium sp. WSM4315]TRC80180.1 DNA mismatch endonuclease Vsr [Mesorhizobium sp. WSM4307]
MREQRTAGTEPEIKLRSALHRRGRRFRVQIGVPNRPRRTIDIALMKQRLAVFVDGCFWHGCELHRNVPRSNNDWWAIKLHQNQVRDNDTDTALLDANWQVLRIWEHEEVEVAVDRIIAALVAIESAANRQTGPDLG